MRKNPIPRRCIASTVCRMLSLANAMCCTPDRGRNQVLLDLALPLPLGGLVDRELDLPEPSCITFDINAEYSVLIALSSKWTSCEKPITWA